jgi:hypothetical protein
MAGMGENFVPVCNHLMARLATRRLKYASPAKDHRNSHDRHVESFGDSQPVNFLVRFFLNEKMNNGIISLSIYDIVYK